MAVGDFSPSRLSELQLKVDEVWDDKVKNRDYTPHYGSAEVIIAQQTANVTSVEAQGLDRTVAVKWIDFCSAVSVEETDDDDCDFAGAEGESKTETLTLDTFISDSFSVVQEDFRGNVFAMENAIAVGLLKIERNLTNAFNAKVNAKLLTFGGTNRYAGAGTIATNNLGYSEVDAANFTAEGMFPYLQQARAMNLLTNLLVLDGGNLYQDNYRAEKYYANDNGKAALNMYGDISYRHDLFGFQANAATDVTIAVDPGSVAIGTHARFSNTPEYLGHKVGETRYSVSAKYIPGARFDVRYTMKCIDGKIHHIWKYKLRAGMWLNPMRCNEDITGVLLFKKTIADDGE